MSFISSILLLFVLVANCFAIPASPAVFSIKQPDGSSIKVRQFGDASFHFYETDDGYILQKDERGFYAYANENGESSGIYARNAQNRSEADKQFLLNLNQRSIFNKLLEKSSADEPNEYNVPKFVSPPVPQLPSPYTAITRGDMRVLVLLVEYADVKFKNKNPKAQFNDFLNKEGYNEYHNVGSVRDYFVKSSNGIFRPTFDVYGPVAVSGKRADYGGKQSRGKNTEGAVQILTEAFDIIKGEIDFTLYDKDNNGMVDFICMIFAGVGAQSSGVDEAIWPNMNYLDPDKELGNGKTGYKFANANELSSMAYYYNHDTEVLEGVGVLIHEFSHVLGLPDVYNPRFGGGWDTGTPYRWDVMDVGANNCPDNEDESMSCAPPLFSAFEQMSMDWLTPEELDFEGTVRLDNLEKGVAYKVTNVDNPDELYVLEYRTNKGWNVGFPNSGMLLWYIDYERLPWKKYLVNEDRSHYRLNVVQAVPNGERETNPFPGSANVTEFDQFVFVNGRNMNISLTDIKEFKDDEYVTFNVSILKVSSSSVEESSSSEAESSSSSELESSSSSVEESSSSSSQSGPDPESSSSSEAESSSSSVEESSSSSCQSGPDPESSSSSEQESSSSSVEESSSSSRHSGLDPESSSSSELESSSSSVEESSSSSRHSGLDPESSSSSEPESSSSSVEESSSSEHPVFIVSKNPSWGARVQARSGGVYVYAPQQGRKIVRFFSPLGTLLQERPMDGSEQVFDNLQNSGTPNLIISVSHGNKQIFVGMVRVLN